MTHINLYGIPYRSWVVMRNLTRVPTPDTDRLLGTSQFSSQERNQAEDFGSLLHSVHDDFHSYFVVVVVVLAAAISALVFMAIIFTLYSYCSCSTKTHKTPPPYDANANVRNRKIILYIINATTIVHF